MREKLANWPFAVSGPQAEYFVRFVNKLRKKLLVRPSKMLKGYFK
jgi:hypothetical protein